jgi:hypothetical protein
MNREFLSVFKNLKLCYNNEIKLSLFIFFYFHLVFFIFIIFLYIIILLNKSIILLNFMYEKILIKDIKKLFNIFIKK